MWPVVQSITVVVAAFLLQAAIVPHISIMGAKPDIVLIVAALYGFMHGPITGSVVGFSGGLLADLLAGTHVGLGMLSKSIVGFFAGLVQRTIFVENILLPMVAIFFATALNELVYVSFLFLLGETIPIKLLFAKIILPSALYNALLTPFVYAAAHRYMALRQEAPMVNVATKYE